MFIGFRKIQVEMVQLAKRKVRFESDPTWNSEVLVSANQAYARACRRVASGRWKTAAKQVVKYY
jgi:hypothetical protein